MSVLYHHRGLKKIEKMNFNGCAQDVAHSKARNKRFQKSAQMLKKHVFKPSYGAFLGTFLADSKDLKTLCKISQCKTDRLKRSLVELFIDIRTLN